MSLAFGPRGLSGCKIDKADVRILDFVDDGHPALLRMWEKRQRGYRSMGYQVRNPDDSMS